MMQLLKNGNAKYTAEDLQAAYEAKEKGLSFEDFKATLNNNLFVLIGSPSAGNMSEMFDIMSRIETIIKEQPDTRLVFEALTCPSAASLIHNMLSVHGPKYPNFKKSEKSSKEKKNKEPFYNNIGKKDKRKKW